jgi:hypothetical protein
MTKAMVAYAAKQSRLTTRCQPFAKVVLRPIPGIPSDEFAAKLLTFWT